MNSVFSRFLALVLVSLSASSTFAGEWKAIVDCKDYLGNQLVIDQDKTDLAQLQLVLRPANDYRNPRVSVTAALVSAGLTDSAPSAIEEIVVGNGGAGASSELAFISSDSSLTHRVFVGRTGAQLSVSSSDETFSWDFPYCDFN